MTFDVKIAIIYCMEELPYSKKYNLEKMDKERMHAFEIAHKQWQENPDDPVVQEFVKIMADEAGVTWPPDLPTEEDK